MKEGFTARACFSPHGVTPSKGGTIGGSNSRTCLTMSPVLVCILAFLSTWGLTVRELSIPASQFVSILSILQFVLISIRGDPASVGEGFSYSESLGMPNLAAAVIVEGLMKASGAIFAQKTVQDLAKKWLPKSGEGEHNLGPYAL